MHKYGRESQLYEFHVSPDLREGLSFNLDFLETIQDIAKPFGIPA